MGVGLRYARKATVHAEEWRIKTWTFNKIPTGIEYGQLTSSWPWSSREKRWREYFGGIARSLEVESPV